MCQIARQLERQRPSLLRAEKSLNSFLGMRSCAGGVINQANGQSLQFAVLDVTVNDLSAVPAPIVGAGLPGMVSVLIGGALLAWCRRRKTAEIGLDERSAQAASAH